jgi:hypothetical protein
MMNESSKPADVATQAANPDADDEAATFVVALVVGILGVVSLLGWLIMFLADAFSEGGTSGVALIEHRGWFLVAGTGLVVLGVGLQVHRIVNFFKQRRSLVALNVALMTLLAFALVVLENYVYSRHYKEFDWTRTGVYSISDESVQRVAGLTKPIRIWVVWPGNDPQLEAVRRLLDHYRTKSDKVTIETADPTTDDPEKFSTTVKLLGLEDRNYDDAIGLVIQSGHWERDEKGQDVWKSEKSKHVSRRELFEQSFDREEGMRGATKFKGEQVVTNALIEVTEQTKPKLYFVTGHQECDLEGQDTSDPNQIGFLAKILRQKNYDVEALDLLQKHSVPSDATVLVIAGPQGKYADEELAAVDAYLKNGGNVLALMAPVRHANATNDKLVWGATGLEPLFRRYNVELPNEELVGLEQIMGYLKPTEACYVMTFDSAHKVTQPLASIRARALMVQTRPIKVLAENPQAKTTELAKCAEAYQAVEDPETWLENPTPGNENDRKARAVLVAVEQKIEAPPPAAGDKDQKKEKVARLIVAGDAHWVSNRLIDTGGFRNEPLILNCFAWLVGQETFIREAVKESNYKLDMGPGLVQVYSAVSLLGMPLFAVILGLSVWLIRRR